MMLPYFVVADATPLHYLVLIGEIDLLERLYGQIAVPSAVVDELSATNTPTSVRSWVASLPPWVSIFPHAEMDPLFFPALGLGEREAISLVLGIRNGILLTDDLRARAGAESVGVQVVPTVRILSTASSMSLVNFEDAMARLRQTNFRISQRVIEQIRRRQPPR
ncbi:MAG: hypothetical protein ABI147_00975 [Acidobacteriaceae bacterium]